MSCSSTAVCRTAVPPARPSATRTYLKMFWRYATSNGINGDRNMIREAFDYKVETGTGKRNFTRPRRWRSCRRRVKKLIRCSAGLRLSCIHRLPDR